MVTLLAIIGAIFMVPFVGSLAMMAFAGGILLVLEVAMTISPIILIALGLWWYFKKRKEKKG